MKIILTVPGCDLNDPKLERLGTIIVNPFTCSGTAVERTMSIISYLQQVSNDDGYILQEFSEEICKSLNDGRIPYGLICWSNTVSGTLSQLGALFKQGKESCYSEQLAIRLATMNQTYNRNSHIDPLASSTVSTEDILPSLEFFETCASLKL